MELTPEISSFDRIKENVLDLLGNSDKARTIIMVCEEMFTNIIYYSGAENVGFLCKRNDAGFVVEFTDDGKAFDPAGFSAIERDFYELDSGGMGIKLARMNSKEMHYERRDEKNHLSISFDL